MKKVVFYNTKGGTGKTTMCYNYGWYLAEKRNKKVLFLDFDPQINLVQSFNFKKQVKEFNFEKFILKYLHKEPVNFADYLIKISDNIDLLPSTNNLSLLEEYLTDYLLERTFQDNKLYQAVNRNKLIKRILDEYIGDYGYDYILIDSQPNYSLLSTTSIIFAKNIVVTLKPEMFSFIDIKYLIKIIDNINTKFKTDAKLVCLMINAYEKRKKIADIIIDKLERTYGNRIVILGKKIRYLSQYQISIAVNKEPVFITFPGSAASTELIEAFEEMDNFVDNLE
jgi:cellulose biosynthesis protein BcsQ